MAWYSLSIPSSQSLALIANPEEMRYGSNSTNSFLDPSIKATPKRTDGGESPVGETVSTMVPQEVRVPA